MATSKAKTHKTPAGGVRSEIYYQDDDGNLADESVATQCEILEYDAQGEVIARTYGYVNNGGERDRDKDEGG